MKEKYGVDSPKTLKEKIEQGNVKGHPAWEELIEWERLEARIKEVEKWRKKMSISA